MAAGKHTAVDYHSPISSQMAPGVSQDSRRCTIKRGNIEPSQFPYSCLLCAGATGHAVSAVTYMAGERCDLTPTRFI